MKQPANAAACRGENDGTNYTPSRKIGEGQALFAAGTVCQATLRYEEYALPEGTTGSSRVYFTADNKVRGFESIMTDSNGTNTSWQCILNAYPYVHPENAFDVGSRTSGLTELAMP